MSDITTTRIFTDGERGITATKLNDIVGSSVIQPAFYTSKPTAGTADPADIALILKSGAYAQVPVSTLAGSAAQAQIWSTRLLSYNSIGNPSFEVDQRAAGSGITLGAGAVSGWAQDRWFATKTGTMGGTVQQLAGLSLPDGVIPGMNFRITRSLLRTTVVTAQASLGVSDNWVIQHFVEGPNFRELQNDVHSISLLVRSSVANLKFGVVLRDPPTATKTLAKLCTIPSANVWTLIQLPNLPIWPSGNFSYASGAQGYLFTIVLAAGSNLIAPANDTWQNGAFTAPIGQSNFFSSPVNSTFDIAFVQHEPGAVCSTLMDLPFSTNLDQALRYYQKSYDLATAVGAAGIGNGTASLMSISGGAIGPVRFGKRMAKVPTMTAYSHVTGTINTLRDVSGAVERTVSAFTQIGEMGFDGITAAGITAAAGAYCRAHYTADAGW